MNKNLLLIFMATAVLSACKKPNKVSFDITAAGLSSGVFVVKNQAQQTVFGENVKDGKCTITKQLDDEGFYDLDIVKDGDKEHVPFEVYLEPGKYTVTADVQHLDRYPKIVSDSKKQQELSNYNALYDELTSGVRAKTMALNQQYNNKAKLSKEAFVKLLDDISTSGNQEISMAYAVLEQYLKKYPQSQLGAHLMAKQNYTEQPDKYLALFNKLTPEDKNSDEGKEIAQKLASLLKMQPGKKAAEIAGKTYDGKTFAQITAGKKLFLIDFWKSAAMSSRTNHDKILVTYNELKDKGFQVISVSMDKKELWWKTAVKDDKLPWPQMSDLKGDDSPNLPAWNLSTIPTYYLVDADWKIYKQDVAVGQIEIEASQYLNKHR